MEFEAGPAANNPGLRAVLRRYAPTRDEATHPEANGIDCGAGPTLSGAAAPRARGSDPSAWRHAWCRHAWQSSAGSGHVVQGPLGLSEMAVRYVGCLLGRRLEPGPREPVGRADPATGLVHLGAEHRSGGGAAVVLLGARRGGGEREGRGGERCDCGWAGKAWGDPRMAFLKSPSPDSNSKDAAGGVSFREMGSATHSPTALPAAGSHLRRIDEHESAARRRVPGPRLGSSARASDFAALHGGRAMPRRLAGAGGRCVRADRRPVDRGALDRCRSNGAGRPARPGRCPCPGT